MLVNAGLYRLGQFYHNLDIVGNLKIWFGLVGGVVTFLMTGYRTGDRWQICLYSSTQWVGTA